MRNLFEKAAVRQAQRITSDDGGPPDLDDVRTLRPEDLAGAGESQRRLSTGLYL